LTCMPGEIGKATAAVVGVQFFKTTGDGMLVEFASVVDAVTGAMVMQGQIAGRKKTPRDITFRIGINVGDIRIWRRAGLPSGAIGQR